MNKEKDNKGKLKRTNLIVYVLLALGGIIMIFPFVWMVATSFKQPWDVFNLSIIPPEVTFSNYIRLFEKSDFPRWFLNLKCSNLKVFRAPNINPVLIWEFKDFTVWSEVSLKEEIRNEFNR